jgi:hypothetical protein
MVTLISPPTKSSRAYNYFFKYHTPVKIAARQMELYDENLVLPKT